MSDAEPVPESPEEAEPVPPAPVAVPVELPRVRIGIAKPLDLTGRERQLRGGMQAMQHVARRFARGARKTLPFLVKRRSRVQTDAVSIVDLSAQRTVEGGPIYEVVLEAPRRPEWACLTLTPNGLSSLLEGALGGLEGGGTSLRADLTLAQSALIGRIARQLGEQFAQAVREEVGIPLQIVSARSVGVGDQRDAEFHDGLSVDCTFEGMPGGAHLCIAISAEALEAAARERDGGETQAGDPRMSQALHDVPVEIVAELGVLRLGLERVLALTPGEVLRLPTPLDEPIVVRVAGVGKFLGRPVISRGQLAIEIRGRHEG